MPVKALPLILLLLLLASLSGNAQTDSTDKKVGLVLSGGGAKCMAQIGALRVIEEAGIKIDYVAGTSMGAIIGAMYSLGYTVDEIEKYMRKVDWDALLSNEIPRNRLSYYDRKSESRYLLTFPIEDNKVTLPKGLNYAQYILKQLSYLTQKSYQYDSFKDFPIPFLCVATNLENGEMKIFEDGSLSDALRASSAFPSLFTPYELNGNLYVDGGVVNNYPVEPLKERGMDYIIGIDVQDFLYEKDQLNSVVRILEQTGSFTNAREHMAQLEYTHLLIKPELEEGGITSFELFDLMMARGEEAARKQFSELLRLAKEDKSKPIARTNCDALPVEYFYVNSINIKGLEQYSETFVLGKLRVQPGETCNIDKLDRGLDQLYGSKYFNNIDYTLTPADTGYNLTLRVVEDQSLSEFRVGLHYDTDLKTALLVNYTKRNLLFRNSRFSAEIAVGDNPRARVNYFVDRGLVPSLGLKFSANRFETRIYENREAVNELNYSDFAVDLFVQSTAFDMLALGGGVQLEGVDLSKDLALTGGDDAFSTYINYYAFLDFDSYNDANYPTEGTLASLNIRMIAEHEDFQEYYIPSSVIDASFGQALSFSPKVSMIASAKGLFTIGPDLDYPYNIFLGSMGKKYINYITPFIGYRFMELPGRNAIVLRADGYVEFLKNHFIMIKANWGKLENSFQQTINSDLVLDGYSLGYSFNSPLGPLEISGTTSTNHSDFYLYINLGFWF